MADHLHSVPTLSPSEGTGVAGKGLRPENPAPPHQLAPRPARVGGYHRDKPGGTSVDAPGQAEWEGPCELSE